MQIPDPLVGQFTVSVRVAAEVLGISRNSAYAAARSGEIPTLRVGRRILVPVAPLLLMLGVSTDDVVLEHIGARQRARWRGALDDMAGR